MTDPAARHLSGRKLLGRLKRRAEFMRLTRNGKRWAMPGLILQSAPRVNRPETAESADQTTSEPAPIHVGFTASKKVGNAVARNRVKRRLRALAAEILPSQGRAGYDYVLVGRREALTRPYLALRDDMYEALSKVHRPAKSGPRDGRKRTARHS